MSPVIDKVIIKTRSSKKRGISPRLGSEMVYIYVEGSGMPVQVHKNIILQSSDFFKNALQGGFKENSGVIQLRGQRKDLVEIYVEWLYFGVVTGFDIDEVTRSSRFAQLYELFVMADLIQDQNFANAIMDTLLKETDAVKMWPTNLAAAAWRELPDGSPMRRYIKDVWVAHSRTTWFNQSSKDVIEAPKEFWVEVAEAYTKIREKTGKLLKPCWANRCRYHLHKKDKQCP